MDSTRVISNSANVHSKAVYPYSIVHKCLNIKFKTKAEKFYFEGLRDYIQNNFNDKLIPVVPSPLIVDFLPRHHHFEPDFLICYETKSFIVELDGSSHCEKSACEEQKRLESLIFNGYIPIHIDSPYEESDEDLQLWAHGEVKNLFTIMDRYVNMGRIV